VDYHMNRLYWVNTEDRSIEYTDLTVVQVNKLTLKENEEPTAGTVYNNYFYYASAHTSAIYSCDKTTGANSVVVRNNTGQNCF
jgi:hypothetical protein